jgi:hypothetical protein
MKLDSEFLPHKLRDLPKDGFVKLFWIMELLGLGGFSEEKSSRSAVA